MLAFLKGVGQLVCKMSYPGFADVSYDYIQVMYFLQQYYKGDVFFSVHDTRRHIISVF